MKRRTLIATSLGAIAAPAIVRAQGMYPSSGAIKLVVPFSAGGPTDTIGRKVAARMTEILGQTMVVENKTGAAGAIGAMEVKNARPDGHTLLFATSSTHAILPTALVNPQYDPVKDFTPISSVCVTPLILVTHPSMPDSVRGLIDLMKKNPGKYSYASSGTASILHLTTEYFKREAGDIEVVHVPYRGSEPAIQDLLPGTVHWMFEIFSRMRQHHKSGKLRILGFAHARRAPIAPDIPTMIEAGMPGFEAYSFNLFLAPAGVSKDVVEVIDRATRKLTADKEMIGFLEDIAAVPTPDTSPARTARFIADEIAKWAPVVKASGIRIE